MNRRSALAAALLALPALLTAQQSATPAPTTMLPPFATAQAPSAQISLDDAIRLALLHNHALLALRSTIEQSMASEITANLRPNPTLGLDAQFLPIFQPDKFSSDYIDQNAQFDAGVGLPLRTRQEAPAPFASCAGPDHRGAFAS